MMSSTRFRVLLVDDDPALLDALSEAMALRLPVVATRVGGIPEAVLEGKTGLLVEPGSVSGLAGALRAALSDPDRLRAMGEAGYQRYLQLFDGDRSVDALVARYVAPSPAIEGGRLPNPG